MDFRTFSVFLCVAFCASAAYGDYADDKIIQNYLKDLEAKNYDKRTAPRNSNGNPVNIGVSSYILDINKIDDLNMDLNAHFYFRQSWNDSRLEHKQDNGAIVLREDDIIWTPDLFFIEEREGSIHQVMHPNRFINIQPSGEVLFSSKVGLTFSCPMDLRSYPHDIQKCTLNAESYGFNKSRINLVWKSGKPGYDPLSAAKEITMLDFDLIEVKPSSRSIAFTFGEYTSLQINLTFKRKFGFFATRLYVPFILLVLMSSFSFFIKAEERFLRLSLLLVILYLMVTISTEVNSLIPPAPYTKASDVWIGFCESLVFAVFLEFIIVASIAGRDGKGSSRGEIIPTLDQEAKEHSLSSDSSKSPMSKLINMFDARSGCKEKRNALAYRIDRICRIVFPLIFVLFNVIYWSVYARI